MRLMRAMPRNADLIELSEELARSATDRRNATKGDVETVSRSVTTKSRGGDWQSGLCGAASADVGSGAPVQGEGANVKLRWCLLWTCYDKRLNNKS